MARKAELREVAGRSRSKRSNRTGTEARAVTVGQPQQRDQGSPPLARAVTIEQIEVAVGSNRGSAFPGAKIRATFRPQPGKDLSSRNGPGKLSDLWKAGDAQISTDLKDARRNYREDAADVLDDIAAWSYSDGQTLADALHHRGIIEDDDSCLQVSVTNQAMLVVATVFFVQSGPVGVLCFRGTEPVNAINWLTDANVEPKRFRGRGRTHGGFMRNVRALWSDIYDVVSAAVDGDGGQSLEALYVAGHSLGGAMAVLAAASIFTDPECTTWRPLIRGVYTYGQPMVGDDEFAASCDAAFGGIHFRHVYQRDLVPRMPPMIAGRFSHSGNELLGSLDGWSPRRKAVAQAMSLLSVPIAFAAFFFKQFPLLHDMHLPVSIDDHSPNSYLEAFRAMRE
ncbi:lipase family protein [Anaeromyxobacter oryzisoli]|uniref:lipase family protein n=1 Tax=Anaeromyxobacter oryzisoli TaxID=2925408 RepID=UPI001F55B466|nr:lipase family protein [Anaeromyxobacter sp. SG63]